MIKYLLFIPLLTIVSTLAAANTPVVNEYCEKINASFTKYGWENSDCKNLTWNHVRNSVNNQPLIWITLGKEEPQSASKGPEIDTTLVLCGVHGDEVTPIKFCFDIIRHLEENKSLFKEKLIVVAPIVNPDSFFSKTPTRTNAHGVDINRNFPTKDWYRDALKFWKNKYKSDKRRFPGFTPKSEPEVVFQMNLIKRYKPNKIISVHAPLTMLDYDGPGDEKHQHASEWVISAPATQLLQDMSEKAQKYKVINYPFYPGSLGNWAGAEQNIPTYTIELPSSDNTKHKQFWDLFRASIQEALLKDFKVIQDSDVVKSSPNPAK